MRILTIIAALAIALPAFAFDFGCRTAAGCRFCWEGANRSKVCGNGDFRHWSRAQPLRPSHGRIR